MYVWKGTYCSLDLGRLLPEGVGRVLQRSLEGRRVIPSLDEIGRYTCLKRDGKVSNDLFVIPKKVVCLQKVCE